MILTLLFKILSCNFEFEFCCFYFIILTIIFYEISLQRQNVRTLLVKDTLVPCTEIEVNLPSRSMAACLEVSSRTFTV